MRSVDLPKYGENPQAVFLVVWIEESIECGQAIVNDVGDSDHDKFALITEFEQFGFAPTAADELPKLFQTVRHHFAFAVTMLQIFFVERKLFVGANVILAADCQMPIAVPHAFLLAIANKSLHVDAGGGAGVALRTARAIYVVTATPETVADEQRV